MTSYMDPFDEKTFYNLFIPWINVINQGECAAIVHIPKRDQLYHIKQFSESTVYLQSNVVSYSQTQFLYIDLGALALDDGSDIKEYIDSRLLKYKRPVIFILDADRLIFEKQNLLSYLDTQYHEIKASIFYFFSTNILYSKYLTNLHLYTTLFQNIIIFPYFEPQETKHFFEYREKQFCPVPKAIKNKILKQCGSCLWLIKEALRYYCKTKNEKDLFTHHEMTTKIRILMNELEPEEKEVLQKIVLRDFEFTQNDEQYIDYLKQTKTIIQKEKKYIFTIPLLEAMIKYETETKNKLSIGKKNSILVNEVPVDLVFSKGEKRLLTVFIKHPHIIISREKAAEALWGDNSKTMYTDWALDQAMWRLRKKCSKLHLSLKLIQTVKNKGFLYKTHELKYGKPKIL